MEQGPLQLFVIGFEDPAFDGSIVEELVKLREAGLVRVVDMLGIYKDDSGNVVAAEASDLDIDEAMDFNDLEYSRFPRTLALDSFFEERNNFANQLTLMSTAGQDYINEINFWFWNNIEDRFSRTFKFTCWWSGPLSEISNIVEDLGGTGIGAVDLVEYDDGRQSELERLRRLTARSACQRTSPVAMSRARMSL